MGKKRIKPDYDPAKTQKEMIEMCSSLYVEEGNLPDNQAIQSRGARQGWTDKS